MDVEMKLKHAQNMFFTLAITKYCKAMKKKMNQKDYCARSNAARTNNIFQSLIFS